MSPVAQKQKHAQLADNVITTLGTYDLYCHPITGLPKVGSTYLSKVYLLQFKKCCTATITKQTFSYLNNILLIYIL